MAGQISKNIHKRPNKIFAAKPLLKTAKYSQFGRKRPSSQPYAEVYSVHSTETAVGCYILLYVVCNYVVECGAHMRRIDALSKKAGKVSGGRRGMPPPTFGPGGTQYLLSPQYL